MNTTFDTITKEFCTQKGVTLGAMMRSSALLLDGKVFAFLIEENKKYTKDMVFKLGKGFDMKSTAVKDWEFLQPFKNKRPMTAWFVVSDSKHWKMLTKLSLDLARSS